MYPPSGPVWTWLGTDHTSSIMFSFLIIFYIKWQYNAYFGIILHGNIIWYQIYHEPYHENRSHRKNPETQIIASV